MPKLELKEIEENARAATDLAAAIKKTQRLLSEVYPGAELVVMQPEENVGGAQPAPELEPTVRTRRRPIAEPSFDGLSLIEKIFTEAKQPMRIGELYLKMVEAGTAMKQETVSSLVSKYAARGKFHRYDRGVWGMPPQNEAGV